MSPDKQFRKSVTAKGGAKATTPFDELHGHIQAMLERSRKYKKEAEEADDLDAGATHARVCCVLKELDRLAKAIMKNETTGQLLGRLRRQATKAETNGRWRKATQLRRRIYDLTQSLKTAAKK